MRRRQRQMCIRDSPLDIALPGFLSNLHFDSTALVPEVSIKSVPSLLESLSLGPVYLAIKPSSF